MPATLSLECRMMSQATTELLTAEELAQRVRVRPDTVRSWSRRGLIPRVQLSPKVIRYDLQSVIAAKRAWDRDRDRKEVGCD